MAAKISFGGSIPGGANIHDLVKIRNFIEFAIPAKAGIQLFQ
jgi:hypothetical protein